MFELNLSSHQTILRIRLLSWFLLKVATLQAKVAQDFFVVGGPVQPDRACYIRRAADEQLLEAISAERFAYVLAPRASGKSSLMGRAIRRLRADGQMAAVIDLTQIGTRAENVDSVRWHYSIAYRICRELRLKVDLQAWWQERSLLLNEQRLVEFFWDIVLANTSAPVTIFFDEAERVIDLPFSAELFAALHSCHMRRVSEPEYSRLNFVVLGAASPEQLCLDPSVSPFVEGQAISLEDFTLEDCFPLAAGLGQVEPVARRLLESIHTWTRGQPYLTQKLARSVGRKGGGMADVDAALHEFFLAPGMLQEEPQLNHMRTMLIGGSPRARQALAILGRLAKGGEVIFDPTSAAQVLLHLGGFVSSDENGMLRFRNRIVERVFDLNWSQSAGPVHWQRPAVAAAATVALLMLVSYWYIRILPQPYIDTLTLVSSDYALAEQAHDRLSQLPGFGRRADRLLAEVMIRRSTEAETIAEVRAANVALRDLPDREVLADQLMAGFWLRRSEAAAHRGERDVALVHAIAAIEAGSAPAQTVAANLIDGDYTALEQSFHFDSALRSFEVDWDRGQIVGVDETQRLYRLPLTAVDGSGTDRGPVNARPLTSSLTALQHVGVTRGFFVDEPGRAASLQLRLTVEHGRTSDLLVRLRAPSGAAAELGLPRRDGGLEQFVFTGSVQNGLMSLAGESIIGQWELTVFDRLSGESGRLVSWGLSFPGVPQFWDDDPPAGIPLPDPMRSEQVAVVLAGDGRKAAAIPSRPDAGGAVSIWDLGSDRLMADLPLVDRANFVRFIAEDRLLVVGPVRATLWQIGATEPVAELVTQSGFSSRPIVSPDGHFFAVAEPVGGMARISLVGVDDGRTINRFNAEPWQDWVLAENASYVAMIDGSRRGRLIDPLSGELFSEFFHERTLDRVIAAPGRIIAVDRAGEIFAWNIAEGRLTLTPQDSRYLGTTVDSDSVEVSAGSLVTYIDANGLVNVSRLSDSYRQAVFGHGQGDALGSRLSPTADRLVSVASTTMRSWRLPAVEPTGHDFGDVSAVAIDSSGDVGVLGFRSGQVRLLRGLPASIDLPGAPPVENFGHRGVVTSLSINASGDLAASGGSDGLVRIWATGTGSPSRDMLRHPSGPIGALAFSPDGRWLVSAGPGSARIFELETGTLVNEVEVDGEALAVAVAPDSRVVAVGDSAGNIFLAAPDGTQGVLTIRGRSPITALRFGDTPSILASGSSDGNLVLWDTLEARAIEGAYSFSAPVTWIDFSPDASQVRLRSGAWLHTLDRSGSEAVVTDSSLLPSRLQNQLALAPTPDGAVRAFTHAGGGHLILADLPDSTIPAPVAGRNWGTVLGLELDEASGVVRALNP